MTWGFDAYFPGEPSDSEVHHQAQGLEEYNSNRSPDSGTILPTSSTFT
jgi:hypothetical protein